MGASVLAYWKGMSEEDFSDQPGFYNDCKAWGEWMAERINHQDVVDSMRELGLEALLTYTTDGVTDDEVDWVTPNELENAARKLLELVKTKDEKIKRIVETYSINANHVDPVEKEFTQDLWDIIKISNHLKQKGIKKFTLHVSW